MEIKEFEEIVCEFVQENFEVTGCRECHETGNGEIVNQDYTGSWEKALEELFERVFNNRIKVESSNLEYVSYNESKEELSIWFKSRKAEEYYVYSKFPVTVFSELIDSKSKGVFFQKSIRNIYDVDKVD